MAMSKLKVGDVVIVTEGSHRGQIGKIIRFNKTRDRLYVQDVNMKVKTVRRSRGAEQDQEHQGFRRVEGSIHCSNVALFDETENKRIKVAIQVVDGKKVRVNRKTGKLVDAEAVSHG